MSRNPEDIRELQIIIDSSDPFLVEAIIDRSTKELEEMMTRLMREKEVIPAENENWMRRQNDIIKTVSALISLRKAYDVDDDDGGISLV